MLGSERRAPYRILESTDDLMKILGIYALLLEFWVQVLCPTRMMVVPRSYKLA